LLLHWWAVGLAGLGLALAHAKRVGALDVTQQGGKPLVRITTKEPLAAVPPNFAVSNPARIAFDFPNTVNALGRASQDVGQGDLRSMNVVQGTDRTRVVLNLRRPVAHEATVDGRSLLITLSEPPLAATAPGGQAAPLAAGPPDTKHAIRDVA